MRLRLFSNTVRILLYVFLIPAIAFTQEAGHDFQKDPTPMKHRANRALMLDIQSVGPMIYAVGDIGIILKSSDHAKTWVQCPTPTRVMLTAVFFVNETHGWAVGHNETILETSDGGSSWKIVRQNLDRDPYLDVWFENETHGIITGAYGVLVETTDGGVSWLERTINDEDDFHLNQIKGAANGLVYIASERNGLDEIGVSYRSDDKGKTWQTLNMPYAGSYFGVLPLAENTVLFFGLRGHVFRSEDSGTSWVEIQSGTNALLNDGIISSKGTVYLVGMGGVVLISHDAGKTFTLKKQSHQRSLSSLTETKDGLLLTAGEGGIHLLEE